VINQPYEEKALKMSKINVAKSMELSNDLGTSQLANSIVPTMESLGGQAYSAVKVPKGYKVSKIGYRLTNQWQVQTTTWTERNGVHTIDWVQQYFPLGQTVYLAIKNPGLFAAADHDWDVGVDALYSSSGSFDQGFEVIVAQLFATGGDAFGYWQVSYIPHANDPANVDLVVTIYLERVW